MSFRRGLRPVRLRAAPPRADGQRPARGDGAPRRPARRESADADLRPAARDEPLQPALQDVRPVGRHGDLPLAVELGRRHRRRPRTRSASRSSSAPSASSRWRTTCACSTRSRRRKPIISLFGGEPFLYPDILPLIREIKRRGLTCTVITNGGRLEALARELVEIGIDSIAVSIDGPPARAQPDPRRRRQLSRRPRPGCAPSRDWRREAGPRAAHDARDPAGHRAQHGRDRRRPSRRCRSCPSTRSTWACAGSSRRKSGPSTSASCGRSCGVDGDLLEGLRLRLGRGRGVERGADDVARQAPEGLEAPAFSGLARWEGRGPRSCPTCRRQRVPEYFSELRRDLRPPDVPGRVVLRAGRAGRRSGLLRRLSGLLPGQRAPAELPRDLDRREGAEVPRQAREGAAADLRALLRQLRLREVGTPRPAASTSRIPPAPQNP